MRIINVFHVGNIHETVNSSNIATPLDAKSAQITSASSNVNPQIENEKKWHHPKPFKYESDEMRISLILKWIFAFNSRQDILSGTEKITNITSHLNRMKYNGYLRLFEIDMNIFKDRMTDTSWSLFQDFKSKHQGDAWKCPQCSLIFLENISKWKCERCLFFYHEKCAIKQNEEINVLCDSCFFSL